MDAVPAEDLVVPRGLERTVAYASDRAGRRWALDFLQHEVGEAEGLQLRHLFTQLADIGRIPSPRKFRKERGDIWAFKTASGARIAAFQSGRVWYLTHGFIKKQDRWPSNELERAERIRWEQLQRNRGTRTGSP